MIFKMNNSVYNRLLTKSTEKTFVSHKYYKIRAVKIQPKDISTIGILSKIRENILKADQKVHKKRALEWKNKFFVA